MKIIICDDDLLWCRHATALLEDYGKSQRLSFEVLAVTDSEALFSVEGDAPDVAFIDIRLQTGDGIAAAQKINELWKDCQIVYLTNYLFYATDVYRTEHAYFVLKKEFPRRLDEVFSKLLHRHMQKEMKLYFQMIGGGQRSFPLREILYFERETRRTYIHTVDGKFGIWETIPQVNELLPKEDFVRCHNSFIVYFPAILEMKERDFLLRDGTIIPISRAYIKRTKDAFAQWAARQMS